MLKGPEIAGYEVTEFPEVGKGKGRDLLSR